MKSLEEPDVKTKQETQEVVLSFQEGTASTSANTVSWQQPMQGNCITICRYVVTKNHYSTRDVFCSEKVIYCIPIITAKALLCLGLPRSSSFEQNLLTTLKSLHDTINEMKANPSATQTQVNVTTTMLKYEISYSNVFYSALH